MNNVIKKIFYNFCIEFEGQRTPQQIAAEDLRHYTTLLKWFTRDDTLDQLNDELQYILKELYLIDIKDPVKMLFY